MAHYIYFFIIISVSKDFESLLEDETPIEGYIEWLESLVNKCAIFVSITIKF